MRTLFAAYGLPEQVVSDNGPQFTSEEFKDFIKETTSSTFWAPHITLQLTGWQRGLFKPSRKQCRQVRIVVNLCRIDWSISSWVIEVHPMPQLTGHQAVCFEERASHSNGPTETRYYCQSDWKTSYRRNVTMIITLKRVSIWLETMLWLETMEMVQSGCPVWWLNGRVHCRTQSSWNQDCCGGDT